MHWVVCMWVYDHSHSPQVPSCTDKDTCTISCVKLVVILLSTQ